MKSTISVIEKITSSYYYCDLSNFTLEFTINKFDVNYVDKLEIVMYTGTNYNIRNVIKTINNVANKDTWTPTEVERTAIYGLCSTVNSRYITCELTTYNGETIIGTDVSSIIGKIVDANPIFTEFTYVPVGITNSLIYPSSLIKNYTTAEARIFDNKVAVGQKGATIVKYMMYCGEKSVGINTSSPEGVYPHYIYGDIPNATDGQVIVTAIDSRGNKTSVTQQLSFIEYEKPIITEYSVKREGSISKNVILKVSGTYWRDTFGQVSNSIQYRYFQYKVHGSSDSYSNASLINLSFSGNVFSFEGNIPGDLLNDGFSIEDSFDILLTIGDRLETLQKIELLVKGIANLAIHKDGLAINGLYDPELGGPLQINGKRFDAILEGLPIGAQIPFAGTVLPTNFYWCHGQELDRVADAELFAAIGTKYGAGNGTTTFNAPDKRGRTSAGYKEGDAIFGTLGNKIGSAAVVLTLDKIPKHSHWITNRKMTYGVGNQPAWTALGTPDSPNADWWQDYRTDEQGGNGAHDNIQPTEIDNWIIKAKNTEGVLPVTGQVIDGFGSTSNVDASSIKNVTELNNKIIDINTLIASMFNFETKVFGGATWMKVYYTNSMNGSVLWNNVAELGQSFQSYKWSILGLLEKFRNASFGGFEFMLEYPSLAKYNRWRQSSNPMLVANSVSGYSPITVQMTEASWGGLALNSDATSAFMDGVPSSPGTSWYYAIGQRAPFNGGIPSNNTAVQEVYLWLRIA